MRRRRPPVDLPAAAAHQEDGGEGAGIGLLPGFLVSDDLDAGRLVRLLPEYRPVELSMNAVYPHRHHLSAKVRTFIDMLVHHSAEQQKLINPYS